MKEKVLFVYYDLDIGGIERKLIRLIESFHRNKINVQLVLFNKEGKLLNQLQKNIIVRDLQKKEFGGIVRVLFNLENIISQEKPKSILVYGDYPAMVVLLARYLSPAKPKVVIGVGNLMSEWVNYQKHGRLRRLVMKIMFRKSDKIIAVSKAVKKDLIESFRVNGNKIKVIYNSVDTKKKKLTHKLLLKKYKQKPVVIYAGRLVKQKRVDFLIKAFKKTIGRIDAKLIIIGEGSEKEKLISLTRKMGADKYVEFKHFTLEIEKELSKASLTALVSDLEGCPHIVLESMVLGTPVLTRDYPGAQELLKDGVSGFLVPFSISTEELADKIINVLSNKKRLISISKNAKKTVKKYSRQRQMREYRRILVG
jgi:glycosyltransferase involved in cell wall biosynthesis